MVAAPEYSLAVQAKLVPALCVLHNFIRIHDPEDEEELDSDDDEVEVVADQEIQITQ